MIRRNSLGRCGRLGLAVGAFALIAGIVASPVLKWAWSLQVAAVQEAGAAAEVPGKPVVEPAAAGAELRPG